MKLEDSCYCKDCAYSIPGGTGIIRKHFMHRYCTAAKEAVFVMTECPLYSPKDFETYEILGESTALMDKYILELLQETISESA